MENKKKTAERGSLPFAGKKSFLQSPQGGRDRRPYAQILKKSPAYCEIWEKKNPTTQKPTSEEKREMRRGKGLTDTHRKEEGVSGEMNASNASLDALIGPSSTVCARSRRDP